jgi:hypothetical protein
MIKKLSDNSVKLCCNNNGCPIVELGADDKFTIKDDYQNVVILSKEEILLVSKAAQDLLND